MSQLLRTYSRKGKRVSRDATGSGSASPERSGPSSLKRQKVTVEIMANEGSTDKEEDNDYEHGVLRPRAHRLGTEVLPGSVVGQHHISSSGKQTSFMKRRSVSSGTLPVLQAYHRAATVSPIKQTQSLPKVPDNYDFRKSTATTPARGVAGRMLRRTRTETSNAASYQGETSESAQLPFALEHTPQKLSLTRTEAVIDLTSTSFDSASHPATPSGSRSQEDTHSPDKGSIRNSVANSNVRTYAGKSRSFLVTLPASHATPFMQDMTDDNPLDVEAVDDNPTEEFETRESYADLRMRWGVDNSEDELLPPTLDAQSPTNGVKGKGKHKQKQAVLPQIPTGMMNDLKSISEQRSKGESRRFLDEMGYLFEGLDSGGGLGVRRGSALDIVSKICDAEFARKAKAADFFIRAWEGFRAAGAGDGDKVLDTILAVFAALISRDAVDLTDLATRSDFVSTMYRLLSHLTNMNDALWLISCGLRGARLKTAGIGRGDTMQLEGLHKMMRDKTDLFSASDTIANRALVSAALAAMPPTLNESNHLPILLKSLQLELAPLTARLSAYTSGLSIFPQLDGETYTALPSLSHIDDCLRLLESHLLGRWNNNNDIVEQSSMTSARQDGLGAGLLALCAALDVVSRDRIAQSSAMITLARKCMESALRVLVNLTHDDLQWCQASVGSSSGLPSIMRLLATCYCQKLYLAGEGEHEKGSAVDREDDEAQCLDRLCLILGLLTNLVQTSAEAKDFIRNIKLSPQCPGKRSCVMACQCSSAVTALECLADIYAEQCKSQRDFDSIVRGHLAVLFGLLMQGHPHNQVVLLRALPGPSVVKKVEGLMENVHEFSLFYEHFVKRAMINTREDEDELGAKLQVDHRIRDSRGDVVVRQVLEFFDELLRNADE